MIRLFFTALLAFLLLSLCAPPRCTVYHGRDGVHAGLALRWRRW